MKKFCVIGYPIKHSLSPKVHNAWFRAKKISARYVAVPVLPNELREFMKEFRAKFSGANVTIPHKQMVMKYLDWILPEAQKIGAVNTIVNRNGKLYGYNTDVFGAMTALKASRARLKGKRAVVLGAGGAARAIIYGLKRAGARVEILNRTTSNAKKLAKKFGADGFGELTDFDPCLCDILVNTTSVGMWPNSKESPLPNLTKQLASVPIDVRKKIVVMDIVYRPYITKLLRDARSKGCKIIPGEKMFIAQAGKSFNLFIQKV